MRTSTRTIERIILNEADLTKMSLIKYIKLNEDVVILRNDQQYYICQRLETNEYAILGHYEKPKGKKIDDSQADGFLDRVRRSGL